MQTKELKELLESKKSNGKTKKGCSSCKKKKPITELPPVIEDEDYIPYIPTMDEIKLAYVELDRRDNTKRQFINKIYRFLFDEDFDWGCRSCANSQANKLKIYIAENFK
jgi:hypothetical protein